MGLGVARLSSAMWVGAALLFVATSVTEQVQPTFDGQTKDTLALIRFPWYYGSGLPLLLIASAGAAIAGRRFRAKVNAATIASLLLFVAHVVLWVDYLAVYVPLRSLLLPDGAGRGAAFDRLHFWSECLNGAVFVLAAAGAVLLQVVGGGHGEGASE